MMAEPTNTSFSSNNSALAAALGANPAPPTKWHGKSSSLLDAAESKGTTPSIDELSDGTSTIPSKIDQAERWRQPGKHFRSKLLMQDSHNTFRINSECSIERYYQVADRVLDQFLQHAIDQRDELVEAYLIGSRLVNFLSTVLPTHPDYLDPSSEQRRQLRDSSQRQLVELLQYMEQIAQMIDRQEHELYISKVLSSEEQSCSLLTEEQSVTTATTNTSAVSIAKSEILAHIPRTAVSSSKVSRRQQERIAEEEYRIEQDRQQRMPDAIVEEHKSKDPLPQQQEPSHQFAFEAATQDWDDAWVATTADRPATKDSDKSQPQSSPTAVAEWDNLSVSSASFQKPGRASSQLSVPSRTSTNNTSPPVGKKVFDPFREEEEAAPPPQLSVLIPSTPTRLPPQPSPSNTSQRLREIARASMSNPSVVSFAGSTPDRPPLPRKLAPSPRDGRSSSHHSRAREQHHNKNRRDTGLKPPSGHRRTAAAAAKIMESSSSPYSYQSLLQVGSSSTTTDALSLSQDDESSFANRGNVPLTRIEQRMQEAAGGNSSNSSVRSPAQLELANQYATSADDGIVAVNPEPPTSHYHEASSHADRIAFYKATANTNLSRTALRHLQKVDRENDVEMVHAFLRGSAACKIGYRRPLEQLRGCVRCLLEL